MLDPLGLHYYYHVGRQGMTETMTTSDWEKGFYTEIVSYAFKDRTCNTTYETLSPNSLVSSFESNHALHKLPSVLGSGVPQSSTWP